MFNILLLQVISILLKNIKNKRAVYQYSQANDINFKYKKKQQTTFTPLFSIVLHSIRAVLSLVVVNSDTRC